jgi:hypothetical protein
MKSAKLRLAMTSGLLGVSLVTAAGAWARPDPDPAPPPGTMEQEPGQLPGPVADRPSSVAVWPAFLTPAVDALILVALLGWLGMMFNRRRREERVLVETRSNGALPERGALRTVSAPSESRARSLGASRHQWIEEFKNLQDAWTRHDLKPVSGIIGPDVRAELELHPAGRDATIKQIMIEQADPADSWLDGDTEFVTVHFSGTLREPEAADAQEFDEYWTFHRPLGGAQDLKEAAPWVVGSIRRGNRERSLPRLAHGG